MNESRIFTSHYDKLGGPRPLLAKQTRAMPSCSRYKIETAHGITVLRRRFACLTSTHAVAIDVARRSQRSHLHAK
jgi:hypothetical protein